VPSVFFGLVAAGLSALAVWVVTGFERPAPPPQPKKAGPSLPIAEILAEPAGRPAAATHPVRRTSAIERQAPQPTRIRIPAIGVNAHVGPLGLAPDHTMETPRNFANTGWFRPGPEPGERGAAVIAGHVDSYNGPAVFYRLGELRRGDKIAITRADRTVIHFRVQGLERWPKSRFPTKRVFGRTRGATLRLITCSGDFNSATGHYLDDTIVYAVRYTRQPRS
jgi:sortase (surface protein transpeptidase)